MEKASTASGALLGPFRALFALLFTYHLILIALQKMGLIKSK